MKLVQVQRLTSGLEHGSSGPDEREQRREQCQQQQPSHGSPDDAMVIRTARCRRFTAFPPGDVAFLSLLLRHTTLFGSCPP